MTRYHMCNFNKKREENQKKAKREWLYPKEKYGKMGRKGERV